MYVIAPFGFDWSLMRCMSDLTNFNFHLTGWGLFSSILFSSVSYVCLLDKLCFASLINMKDSIVLFKLSAIFIRNLTSFKERTWYHKHFSITSEIQPSRIRCALYSSCQQNKNQMIYDEETQLTWKQRL